MSFIGLITQKDKPTGVTLRAKIVTANKKKSKYKTFDVSIKPNGLDDYTCCLIYHSTAVEKINSLHDMTQIIDNINLTYSGINDTTISYNIIDVNTPYLSAYLENDGKINGRPKYGEGDAIGYIEIIVRKNDAKVTSRIQTVVKAVTADEVLNNTTFTQANLWNLIRKNNEPYQQRSEWSGHNNISSDLNLISSKEINNISNEAVAITWKVQDSTIGYVNNIYTEPRINEDTGVVSRCSYADACTLVDNIPIGTAKVITTENSSLNNRVRISGITLTATLTLGEASKEIIFNCATISKYITSKEVIEVVRSSIYLSNEDNEHIFSYKEDTSHNFSVIQAPASGGIFTLVAFGANGSQKFASNKLHLKEGQIIGVEIKNTLIDFNGSGKYENDDLFNRAFNSGFQSADMYYDKLVINLDELKNAEESDKTFACRAIITVSGYSMDGITLGGSPLTMDRYAPFKVDTSAITSEEE